MGSSKSSAPGRGNGICWDDCQVLWFAPTQSGTKGEVYPRSLSPSFQALLTVLTEGDGTYGDVWWYGEEVLLQTTGVARPPMVPSASPNLHCPSPQWAKKS